MKNYLKIFSIFFFSLGIFFAIGLFALKIFFQGTDSVISASEVVANIEAESNGSANLGVKMEFIGTEIAKIMGLKVSIQVKAAKGLSENSSTENNVQENISEVFDIENID